MFKKILIGLGGLVAFFALGAVFAYLLTSPEPPPADSASARWLAPGPYAVGEHDLVLVDQSRPTQANGDYAGAPSRTLVSKLWYPRDHDAAHPLLVYSHGFMSNKLGGSQYAQHLASYGYVVIAADFPLTNGAAPGGALVGDVVHQPADVSFLIDSLLVLDGPDKVFQGQIDRERIGLMGLSLGGLTSTLAGYHPRWRDERVRAVASIAGPASMFTPAYFRHAPTPFLMVAGTVDAIVPYAGNADIIPERAPQGALVTIEGGSHLGFASIAEPMLRAMDNPDSIGCQAILANIGEAPAENPFAGLGTPEEGISFDTAPELCGMQPLPTSIHPGRQHMVTSVALLGFFEANLAPDATRRADARRVLSQHLAQDFPEVAVAY